MIRLYRFLLRKEIHSEKIHPNPPKFCNKYAFNRFHLAKPLKSSLKFKELFKKTLNCNQKAPRSAHCKAGRCCVQNHLRAPQTLQYW